MLGTSLVQMLLRECGAEIVLPVVKESLDNIVYVTKKLQV